MDEQAKTPTQSRCRCEKSSYGCAGAAVERCACGTSYSCRSACRCVAS